jgi:hypothetical protein
MDFYLFVSQEATKNNSWAPVNLPKDIALEGVWEVALAEIALEKPAPCFVCCNFVEESTVNSHQLPVLRQLFTSDDYAEFSKEQFFKVTLDRLRQIRLYLADKEGDAVASTGLSCVLHFRWSRPS